MFYIHEDDIMHLGYGIFEMVDVDFQNIEVEFLAFLNKMRLNSLVLSDLFIHIRPYVSWKILLRLLRKLLGDLALETECMTLR